MKPLLTKTAPKGVKVDDEKFKQLLLFIAKRSEDDPRYGATKLNKLLFFADFLAYAQLGKPITGQTYFRLKMGPAPKRLLPLRRELFKAGAAAIERRNRGGRRAQERVIALVEPNLKEFTGAEIALVEEIIRELWDMDGTDLSDLSHRMPAWQAFEDEDEIPYQAVFVQLRPLTEAECVFGRSLSTAAG